METLIHATNLASALGLGLLVGFERERKKGEGADRRFAGLRTFALTSLLGYVGLLLGGPLLLSALTLALAMLASMAYFKRRSEDPGMTTGSPCCWSCCWAPCATARPDWRWPWR
ncbi:MgtC/SapB family protein [Pseudomonas sp. PCH446]